MQELVLAKDLAGIVSKERRLQPLKRGVKKLTILIADNSLVRRNWQKNIIENSGYEVDIAVDGMDALDRLYHKEV